MKFDLNHFYHFCRQLKIETKEHGLKKMDNQANWLRLKLLLVNQYREHQLDLVGLLGLLVLRDLGYLAGHRLVLLGLDCHLVL